VLDETGFDIQVKITEEGYERTNGALNKKEKISLKFGETDSVSGLHFFLTLKDARESRNLLGQTFTVSRIQKDAAIEGLSDLLQINKTSKDGDIISISIQGTNKDKNEDILNTLVQEYNSDGMADKQIIAQSTISFINDRLFELYDELDSIEYSIEKYLVQNDMVSIESDAEITTTQKYGYQEKINELNNQLQLSFILEKALKSDKKFGLIPDNIGVSNAGVNNLVSAYNSAVLQRNKLAASAGENNPELKFLNAALLEQERNTLKTIANYRSELTLSLNTLNKFQVESNARFKSIPNKGKTLRSIGRKQGIKESLYLLLLQKREEAGITLASTAPSVKLLDYASTRLDPVSPKRLQIFILSILFSIALPIAILFLKFALDNKIHDSDDVTIASPNIPLIAELPKVAEDKRQVKETDNSPLAEAFRMLRTNVNYMLPIDLKGKAPIIMVTSTIKGEGKTFTSMNLAFVYANTNKKVLLIGSDMRNPQLHKYLNIEKEILGLSNFLHDSQTAYKDLIIKNAMGNNCFDVLLAGNIPPNPAELLTNGRLSLLLEDVRKEYDYIIVDTAPSLLVTDTLLIAPLADILLYVCSVKITEKRLMNFSKELKEEGKFNNIAYVLNNVLQPAYAYKYGYRYAYGYNYGYGYGYGADAEDETNKKKKRFKWFK
jgi:capsular exopolysaccharide synthesis family protein